MNPRPTSTARDRFYENAQERLRLALRLFDELTPYYLDFHERIESALLSSSPGSLDARSLLYPESPSQT